MNTPDAKRSKRLLLRGLFSLLLISSLAAIIAYGIDQLYATNVGIAVSSTLTKNQQLQVNKVIDEFTVDGRVTDVDDLQQAIGQLPWVHESRVHRNIGRYLIDIQVFTPIAELNERWFLSYQGKRKYIYDDSGYTDLIKYQFDPQQQKTILPQAQKLQKQLQSIHLIVKKIRVSLAGNWSVVVDPETSIHFGVSQLDEKFNRLAKLLPSIQERGVFTRIDLRNERGIAVRYVNKE